MGIVHHTATLSPTKQELVEAWLPSRSWAEGRKVTGKVGEYRFDDPAGEVGIETCWSAPTTARAPRRSAHLPCRASRRRGGWLVGTTEHSVLGPRWVYDGCGDPVWAAALVQAISRAGDRHRSSSSRTAGASTYLRIQVRGSGSDDSAPQVTSIDRVVDEGAVTVVTAGDVGIAVARVVGPPVGNGPHLSGSVGDSDETDGAGRAARPEDRAPAAPGSASVTRPRRRAPRGCPPCGR